MIPRLQHVVIVVTLSPPHLRYPPPPISAQQTKMIYPKTLFAFVVMMVAMCAGEWHNFGIRHFAHQLP